MALNYVDREMSLIEHLEELRQRLIKALLAVGVGAVAGWWWTGPIMEWLARPLGGLIFLGPTEAFFTRLKLALFAGLLLALPVVLYQLWAFTACAIGERARRLMGALVPASYVLFISGVLLAVLFVVPTATRFLVAYGTENVKPMLSVAYYADFVAVLAVAFGLVFQLPLVLILLNRLGLVSRETLSGKRRMVYFLGFVAAAMMTPGPDVISQLALAVPIALLFEASLLVMRLWPAD